MKKKYIQPELDILQFGEEDIIRTSGPDGVEDKEVMEDNWDDSNW